MDFIQSDRAAAITKAREIMAARPLFIDTETTGLDERAEICDIAVIDGSDIILNTLIRPTCPIPEQARAVHGITDEMVQGAPEFDKVFPLLTSLFCGRLVVTYNAAYDSRMIRQSHNVWFGQEFYPQTFTFSCAMLLFSEWYGDWNEYRQSYKWQKLETAARCANYPTWTAHRALGDALATRAVMQWLAGQEA